MDPDSSTAAATTAATTAPDDTSRSPSSLSSSSNTHSAGSEEKKFKSRIPPILTGYEGKVQTPSGKWVDRILVVDKMIKDN